LSPADAIDVDGEIDYDLLKFTISRKKPIDLPSISDIE
jgi:hypothetical protein